MLVIEVGDSIFVVINIYNANTELEQLHTFNILINIPVTFKDIQSKSVVLSGDYHVILNPSVDLEGSKSVIKKKIIGKLIQITDNLDLCDIWRFLCIGGISKVFQIALRRGQKGNFAVEIFLLRSGNLRSYFYHLNLSEAKNNIL